MKLVTAQELAEMLSVSPRTIQEWGQSRGMPRVKLSPRCVRYDPVQIMGWFGEQRAFQKRVKPRPRRRRSQFSIY